MKQSDESKKSLSELSDEQLLLLHRKGQSAAFETLMKRRSDELYRFLFRFCQDRALADDVFQETFIQVHQSADSFDVSRSFRPWLFTIAANKARDAMRSRSRRKATSLDVNEFSGDGDHRAYIDLLEAEIQVPSDLLENRELRQAVRDIVQKMPEHFREVLLLTYFQQLPYKEVAEILSVPLGTVKSRLHAAVKYFALKWQSVSDKFS